MNNYSSHINGHQGAIVIINGPCMAIDDPRPWAHRVAQIGVAVPPQKPSLGHEFMPSILSLGYDPEPSW